ncbi:hypothetical protein, partial [Streptomyces sp. NPDC047968]|uniref:hypothetical protein n=1 Tax=Streptomyces sp. NPDC047968 TaxID=3155382 RepID=UPI003413B75F
AAGALFTSMVSKSHDLPWPKALGASHPRPVVAGARGGPPGTSAPPGAGPRQSRPLRPAAARVTAG